MNLYLFNPDADLALAHHTESYIAPAAVRQMAYDLAFLPAWYAESGSAVLLPPDSDTGIFQPIQALCGLPVRLITAGSLSPDMQLLPWGWNLSLRHKLLQEGWLETQLPSVSALEYYRAEASRCVAAQRLSGLFGLPWCTGHIECLTTLPACRTYVEAVCVAGGITGGRVGAVLPGCVLKAPWSGSGKGLKWCREGFTPAVQGWCERLLREQGCVVASPIYDKVKDFAMEFYIGKEGQVTFVGYSSFSTSAAGAYQGNELLSDEAFESQLAAYIPLSFLQEVRTWLKKMLASYARAGYRGYLGVDMMVCRSSSGFLLHPGVEVNLRMNMGVVALALQRHWLAPGCTGRFSIEYFSSGEALQRQHRADTAAFPLCVEQGKILSGYLSLTPVTAQCRYRAAVWVAGSPSLP